MHIGSGQHLGQPGERLHIDEVDIGQPRGASFQLCARCSLAVYHECEVGFVGERDRGLDEDLETL
jgi:hypothetical protein